MLNGKKIIFVGPLGNPSDEYLNGFHYVIRTNNFFSIKKDLIKSQRCDILAVNGLYSVRYNDFILENLHRVKYVWAAGKGYQMLKEKVSDDQKDKILYMKWSKKDLNFQVKKHPLFLSRILYHLLKYYKPEMFCVTGIDFYKSKNIKGYWLPGYAVTVCRESKKLATGVGKHDIESNKKFLKYLMKKHKWIVVDKLVRNILAKVKL